VPTTGGLHINIQYKYRSLHIVRLSAKRDEHNHSDLVRPKKSPLGEYERREFKQCAGFLQVQCLISQMIIKSARMKADYTEQSITDLKKNIIKSYPKSKQLLMVNLLNDMI
jgi:hypothetical protein